MTLYLADNRFGRLQIISREPITKSHQVITCRCDCGRTMKTEAYRLKHTITRSCGCLQAERSAAALRKTTFKHGWSGTATYRAWSGMLSRCNNPRNMKFANYGGRGIHVSERWKNFDNFLLDMGQKPSVLHSLDRIDNNGHYEPGNVRWALQIVQQNNRRDNRLLLLNGISKTCAELAREYGISPTLILQRIDRDGWSIEEAVRPV